MGVTNSSFPVSSANPFRIVKSLNVASTPSCTWNTRSSAAPSIKVTSTAFPAISTSSNKSKSPASSSVTLPAIAIVIGTPSSAGSNSILSKPGFVFEVMIASRKLVTPSAASITSAAVVTCMTVSRRRCSKFSNLGLRRLRFDLFRLGSGHNAASSFLGSERLRCYKNALVYGIQTPPSPTFRILIRYCTREAINMLQIDYSRIDFA